MRSGLAFLVAGVLCAMALPAASQVPPVAPSPGFVHAEGAKLILDGKPFRFRAVNVSNDYHLEDTADRLLEYRDRAREDFVRIKELGFNSIRFAFEGDWRFEQPESFWIWLDASVALAREYNIRLILDMHTPVDSFWLDPMSEKVSFAIWDDPEARRRNIELWREIAERYKDDPFIGAYDVVNEPVTTDTDGQQWRDLAAELVKTIREVDSNHLIVIGELYGVSGKYGAEELDSQFLVDDRNVMYDFHFYEPIKYTHQFAEWVEGPVRDGGKYPDPNVLLPTGDQTLLSENRIGTLKINPGTTDWTLYESAIKPIKSKNAIAALPMVTVRGAMKGKVMFDDVSVEEYGPDGKLIRIIRTIPLKDDDTLDWYSWESGEPDPPSTFVREKNGCHEDTSCLSIADTGRHGKEEIIAGWSNDDQIFAVKPGNRYRIQGYIKGENVVLDKGTEVGFDIDVYARTKGAPGGGFLQRDKTYLQHEMEKHLAFGWKNNVPMSVLEFGLVKQAFEMSDKGGRQWVLDVLDLLAKNNLSFAYWEYRGNPMGLYYADNEHPGMDAGANDALIATLREALASIN